MAFAVAGTKIPGLVIRNPEVVDKTFPEFWEKLLGVMGGNVVLIGMRGTGKSTVGLLLAGALNKRFVDMDAEIVKLAGMSISEIVERYGWEHFRNLETALTRELGETGNLVIAAGGGVVLRPENVAALGARGTYVLLISPVNVLAGRIAGETDRPSLTAKKNTEEELEELWRLREAAYRRVARFVVETQNKKPEVVAQEIRRALSGAGL
jgi:shikimate kinase